MSSLKNDPTHTPFTSDEAERHRKAQKPARELVPNDAKQQNPDGAFAQLMASPDTDGPNLAEPDLGYQAREAFRQAELEKLLGRGINDGYKVVVDTRKHGTTAPSDKTIEQPKRIVELTDQVGGGPRVSTVEQMAKLGLAPRERHHEAVFSDEEMAVEPGEIDFLQTPTGKLVMPAVAGSIEAKFFAEHAAEDARQKAERELLAAPPVRIDVEGAHDADEALKAKLRAPGEVGDAPAEEYADEAESLKAQLQRASR